MGTKQAGSSFKDAKNLGKLSKRLRVNDSLSKSDPVDFFKVNVSKTSSVSASLGKLKKNATIQLFNKKKSAIDQASFKKGGKGRGILRNLDRGQYYLQVSLTKGKKTSYQLQLGANKPRPEPGKDAKAALNIGRLRGTYTDKRLVNDPDPNRFYRFTLNQITDLETTISTASGSVQANLIFDANGNRKVDDGEIVNTTSSSFSSGSVVTLPKGQYYMQVQPRFTSDVRIEYDLKMVAKPDPGNLGKKGGGDSLKKSRNIGALDRQKAGTFLGKDYVGTLDEVDVFKFNLKEISSVEMLLESKGSTEAELIFDKNGNKQVDSGEVLRTAASSFGDRSQTLTPGTYYVRVSPRFSNSLSTRYDLSLVATSKPSNLNTDPGDRLSDALSVGILNQLPTSTFVGKDYVGVQDAGDAFQFQLSETRNVNFRISSDESTSAALIFDANGNGLVDPGDTLATTSDGSSLGLTRTLAPGAYYVLVAPRFGDSTAYELTLTT